MNKYQLHTFYLCFRARKEQMGDSNSMHSDFVLAPLMLDISYLIKKLSKKLKTCLTEAN